MVFNSVTADEDGLASYQVDGGRDTSLGVAYLRPELRPQRSHLRLQFPDLLHHFVVTPEFE